MRITTLLSLLLCSLSASAAPVTYADVQPVLEAKCFKCHGPDARRPKAGLKLDSLEAVLKGSYDGAVLVPGKPEESTLYTLAALPAEDEDRMPPVDKAEPLTTAELELLATWIREGSDLVESGEEAEGEGAKEWPEPTVDFEKSILPVFERRCAKCHGHEKERPKADLVLTSPAGVRAAMTGDDAVIVRGQPEASVLHFLVCLPDDEEDRMPPKGARLTEQERADLATWITEGAQLGKWGKPEEKAAGIDFAKEVLPILDAHCFKCHSPRARRGRYKGDLRLDTKEHFLRGGENGKVIVAGDPDASSLYRFLTLPAGDDMRMPPKGDPLSDAELKTIRDWILQGANFGDWK